MNGAAGAATGVAGAAAKTRMKGGSPSAGDMAWAAAGGFVAGGAGSIVAEYTTGTGIIQRLREGTFITDSAGDTYKVVPKYLDDLADAFSGAVAAGTVIMLHVINGNGEEVEIFIVAPDKKKGN